MRTSALVRSGLAVSLALGFAVTATVPATADTNTFLDPSGEPEVSPDIDVVKYRVSLDTSKLTVSLWTNGSAANPLDETDEIIMLFDVDGDDVYDYQAYMENATTWRFGDQSTELCTATGTLTANTASVTIPSSCHAFTAVGVAIETTSGQTGKFDYVPELEYFSTATTNGPDTPPTTAPQVLVYRFWSARFNNAHFFTTDAIEAWNIDRSDSNWAYEGTAFAAIGAEGGTCADGSAVYRFYSPVFQSHFYTMNAAEKASIIANDRNWTYEGVAYCGYPSQAAGTVPLYRFWSPGFGKHFFTADKGEADHIRAVDRNWNYEGIAYYVLPYGGQA